MNSEEGDDLRDFIIHKSHAIKGIMGNSSIYGGARYEIKSQRKEPKDVFLLTIPMDEMAKKYNFINVDMICSDLKGMTDFEYFGLYHY